MIEFAQNFFRQCFQNCSFYVERFIVRKFFFPKKNQNFCLSYIIWAKKSYFWHKHFRKSVKTASTFRDWHFLEQFFPKQKT